MSASAGKRDRLSIGHSLIAPLGKRFLRPKYSLGKHLDWHNAFASWIGNVNEAVAVDKEAWPLVDEHNDSVCGRLHIPVPQLHESPVREAEALPKLVQDLRYFPNPEINPSETIHFGGAA